MAYRFRKKDKSLGHAARRMARDQVDKAIAAVDEADPATEAVREVRERCRRIIGIVGLLEPLYGSAQKEIRAFGKMRDELAAASNVLALADIRNSIDTELAGKVRSFTSPDNNLDREDTEAQLARIRRRLVKSRKRIEGWKISDKPVAKIWDVVLEQRHWISEEFPNLCQGLKGDDLHKFRKRVRAHWHHLRMFRAIGSNEVPVQERSAKQLVELLGRLRDIEQLELRLVQSPGGADKSKKAQAVMAFCKREKTVLRGKTTRLAKTVLEHRYMPF